MKLATMVVVLAFLGQATVVGFLLWLAWKLVSWLVTK
jgi:hypothetical protein